MTILNIKDFTKKYNLANNTMNECELKRVYKYSIYHRISTITTKKGFVSIDNGSMGETHWTCFCVKDKSFYLDSFGGQLDKFSLKQLPKPITFHNYKI